MHITIPKGVYPLYHHQGQTDPQPGRIWLHIGGRIVCGYDAHRDGLGREHETIYACHSCAAELPEEA